MSSLLTSIKIPLDSTPSFKQITQLGVTFQLAEVALYLTVYDINKAIREYCT